MKSLNTVMDQFMQTSNASCRELAEDEYEKDGEFYCKKCNARRTVKVSILGKELTKTGIKKGLDGFKDLGRLLEGVSFTIFCIIIYNKKFITICKTLINLKANSYLFISKLFV